MKKLKYIITLTLIAAILTATLSGAGFASYNVETDEAAAEEYEEMIANLWRTDPIEAERVIAETAPESEETTEVEEEEIGEEEETPPPPVTIWDECFTTLREDLGMTIMPFGSSAPITSTTLPTSLATAYIMQPGAGGIDSFMYQNHYFSNVSTASYNFSGYMAAGAVNRTVRIRLYDLDAGTYGAYVSPDNVSFSVSNTPSPASGGWASLSTSHRYFFVVQVEQVSGYFSTLHFTLKIWKSA
jgi:hypothetical protein